MSERLGLVAVTFVIAALSQRYVEEPFRRGRFTYLRTRRSLALAGATTLAVALMAVAVGQTTRLPGEAVAANPDRPAPVLVLPTPIRGDPATGAGPSATRRPRPTLPPTVGGAVPEDVVPPLLSVRSDVPPIYSDHCHLEATESEPGECAYGVVDAPVTAVLFGDSHAAQWFPALEAIALERGWRLVSLTKGSCPAADISVWSPSQKRLYAECDEFRAAVLDRIARERPELVFISSSRIAGLMVSETESVASRSHDEVWGPALERMLLKLMPLADEVVVIGDTPNPKGDPSACLSAHLDDILACTTPAKVATAPRRTRTEARVAKATGTTFIDPTNWVCPSDPCPALIGQFLVWRDGGHIATAFARALAPYIARKLPSIP